jgi:hypothetical protein
LVRNQWLKQDSGLIPLSMMETMQHQEKARPLGISQTFSGLD